MISKIIRIVLTVLLFGLSVWQFVEENIGNGIFLMLMGGIVLLSIYKNEMITLAFWYVRKQDFAKASKYLGYIKDPDHALVKGQRAYYYFLKGIMASQTNLNEAEKMFKKALSIGLKQDHDKAMAKLQLAAIAAQKRRKREATQLLSEAKKLDKNKMLTEQIKMIKQGLQRI